ncbi:MAG TPA: TonB-dependent receptor [Planctomycetota bacterium]|nr:TonB-dependent receptor [Planctomycetota bacterium]
MERLGKITGLGLVTIGCMMANSVFADEPSAPITKTNEIIVTATRSEKELLKIPANVTVISEADIKKSNARCISEILKSENGLMVNDWTGTGKTVTIDIRGFGESGPLNTLVLVDGRRVTQVDLAGTDWSQIPIEDVSKIEIVRGAGSILYGDNATAGTINIITKKGAQGVNTKLNTFSGSYNTHNSTLYANGGNQDLTFSVNQSYRNTDGYRRNSYLNSDDKNINLGLLFGNEFNAEMSLGIHNDEYGLPGYLTPVQIAASGRRSTTTPNDLATTEDYYYKLKVNNSFDDIGDFTTDLSLRNKTSSSTYSGWGTFDNKIDSMHLAPRYIREFGITGQTAKITTGVDWLKDQGNLSGTGADKDSLGLYLLGEIEVSKKYGFSTGYRHEKAFYSFNGGGLSARKTLNEDVFHAGLTYLYQDNNSVYLNYNQSFRFPAIDEYFSSWSGLNSSLKPQSGQQVEIGVKHNPSEYLMTNLSVFSIDVDNEIFYNPYTPPFGQNENYDKIQRQGVEAKMEYKPGEELPRITLNYTYTQADFQQGVFKGNEVPGVPHNKAGIIITTPPLAVENLNMNLYYNYVGSRYLVSDQPNQQSPLDAYNTVDAKFIYQYKKVKASLGVNNLFNQRYEEYGSTNSAGTIALYPSPERNYMLGLAVEF